MILLDAAGQEEKARAEASSKDANGEAIPLMKLEADVTEVTLRLEATATQIISICFGFKTLNQTTTSKTSRRERRRRRRGGEERR